MVICIHCGKPGKKICETCLEKSKKEKLIFLFPLKSHEITTITDVCRPKPVKAEVTVTEAKPKELAEVNSATQKVTALGIKTEPTELKVKLETETVPKKVTVEDIFSFIDNQRVEHNATSTQQKEEVKPANMQQTTSTNYYGLDDDDDYPLDDVPNTSSGGSWGWWIALGAVADIIVTSILLPWSISQWIVGISIGLIVLVGFLLCSFVAYYDDDFTFLDIVLLILSGTNIGLMLWIKSGYSTIAFVIAIALAISSFIVMGRAYIEDEDIQGHCALLIMLINVASIFMDRIVGYVTQLFSSLI